MSTNAGPTAARDAIATGGSIGLGDLIRAVAADAYVRLERHIASMPAMSPELRTEKTRTLVARMRKELAQLYAVVKWLQGEDVQRFLVAMEGVNRDVQARHMSLNIMQDGLFFTHQSLYGQRIRPLDVASAADILSSGTYRYLPEAAFEFMGTSLLPAPTATVLEVPENIMNMCIASKLKLGPRLPDYIDEIDVERGVLRISKISGFTLKLSLNGDTETSPWTVISVDVTVTHRDGLGSFDGIGREALNFSLLNLLRRLAGGSQSADTLLDLCTVCMHAVSSAWLRLLYLQALDASRAGIASGIVQAEYFEVQGKSIFVYDFWRLAKNSGPFQYQLQISLPRTPSDALTLELFQLLDSNARLAPRNMRLNVPQDVLKAVVDRATLEGVCFESISSFAVQHVSKLLLSRVYAVLANDSFKEITAEMAGNGLSIALRPKLTLSSVAGGSIITIGVSASTGRFVVLDAPAIFDRNKDSREALNLLIGELNGVIQNLSFKMRTLLSDAVESMGVGELKTLPGISRCFFLQSAVQRVSRALGNPDAMLTADKCDFIDRMLRKADGIPADSLRQNVILKTGRIRADAAKTSSRSAKASLPATSVVDAIVVLTLCVDSAMKTSVHVSSGILMVSADSSVSATLFETCDIAKAYLALSSVGIEEWLQVSAEFEILTVSRCFAEVLYWRLCFGLSGYNATSIGTEFSDILQAFKSRFAPISDVLVPRLHATSMNSWNVIDLRFIGQRSHFPGSVQLAVPVDLGMDPVVWVDGINYSAGKSPIDSDAIGRCLVQSSKDSVSMHVSPSWQADTHVSLLDIGGSKFIDVIDEFTTRHENTNTKVISIRDRSAFAILSQRSRSQSPSSVFASSGDILQAVALAYGITRRWSFLDSVRELQLAKIENTVTLESQQIISLSSNGFMASVDFFVPGVSAPAFAAEVTIDAFDASVSGPEEEADPAAVYPVCIPMAKKINPLGLSDFLLSIVNGFCIEVFSYCLECTEPYFSDAPVENSLPVLPPEHALAIHADRAAIDAYASICLALSVAKVINTVRARISASGDASVRMTDINLRFRQILSPARWSIVIVATTTRHPAQSASQQGKSKDTTASGASSSSSSVEVQVRSAVADVTLSINGGAFMYSAKISAANSNTAPDAVAGHVFAPRLGEELVRFVGTMQ